VLSITLGARSRALAQVKTQKVIDTLCVYLIKNGYLLVSL
jgi:hypothetical protein